MKPGFATRFSGVKLRHISISFIAIVVSLAAACNQPARSNSLPADWPLMLDLLPADAKVSVAFSSQEYEAKHGSLTPNIPDLPPDKAARLEQMRTNDWNINFTTALSPEACREHLEQVLKDEDYRYIDDSQPDPKNSETNEIRWYYSPDGKYALALNQVTGREVFLLLLIESIHPDTKDYNAAFPIK